MYFLNLFVSFCCNVGDKKCWYNGYSMSCAPVTMFIQTQIFFVQNKGNIVNRNYDFSPSGFFMNLERFQFIDFTSPLFENRVGNYVNRNKLSHSLDWAFFIRPFNNTSWICSLGNKSKRFFIFCLH